MGSSCCGHSPNAGAGTTDPLTSAKPNCCTVEEECDETCLPIAAQMITELRKPAPSAPCESGSPESCYSETLEKLRRLLEGARCICQSVIDAGSDTSCCTNKKKLKAASSPPSSLREPCSSTAAPPIARGCCASRATVTGQSCCSVKDLAFGEQDDCCAKIDACSEGKDSCCGPALTTKDSCCNERLAGLDKQKGSCNQQSSSVDDISACQASKCCDPKPLSKDSCASACCGPSTKGNTAKTRGLKDPCCSTSKAYQYQRVCGVEAASNRSLDRDQPSVVPFKRNDAEQAAGWDHIALSVDGMTCNDCASKLERTLNAMDGIARVNVNFIRGQADFSINSAQATADDIVKRARQATGFGLTRRATGSNEHLDLFVGGNGSRAISELGVEGVNDIAVLNKTTVRVSYDPSVIGARQLFEKIGTISSGLAPPVADAATSGGQRRFYFLLLMTALSTAMTVPVLVMEWSEDAVPEHSAAVVSFVLATFVQLLAIPIFYKPALKALVLYRALELDMLVVVSITAAYVYSVTAFGFRMARNPLDESEFFETSTLLITLVMLGRLLATYARIRAVAAVSLKSLQSTTAIVMTNGGEKEIDSRLLQYGDQFRVLPHSRIVTNGTVVEGSSDVDESMLTGESIPVLKMRGSDVVAGTMNTSGSLVIELTRLPGRNTVTDISRLVEEASNSKPRVQDLADRVASYFLPVVGVTAVIVFIIWTIVGITVRKQPASVSVSTAITYAIAVLAVSCPCALGLAVPMVLVTSGGIGARGGVIIKSSECIERSRKVTDVVFDKTGTLTQPDLDVLEVAYFGADHVEALSVSKAMVSENTHPVSVAVANHLSEKFPNQAAVFIESVKSVPGLGVEGVLDSEIVRAGNPSWTHHEDLAAVRQLTGEGMTVLLITRESVPLIVFGLRARLRPEATNVVSDLRGRGLTVHLVSGDHARAVLSVASAVGIDETNTVASHTPEQKRAYVANLMASNRYVLFCGDGTNDAVAVAQADIGAQLCDTTSSDITQAAADVVLLSGLSGVPFLLDVSRASFRRIVFNFVWSATYNILAILLASGAFVRIRIPPAYAGAGELVSVLPVIAAAMSMLAVKLKP